MESKMTTKKGSFVRSIILLILRMVVTSISGFVGLMLMLNLHHWSIQHALTYSAIVAFMLTWVADPMLKEITYDIKK